MALTTRHYRGFTIRADFLSASGTGQICRTRQGWIIEEFVALGLSGWCGSLTRARTMIDRAYERYEAGDTSVRIAEAAARVVAATRPEAKTWDYKFAKP